MVSQIICIHPSLEYEYYIAYFYNSHVHKHLMVDIMIRSPPSATYMRRGTMYQQDGARHKISWKNIYPYITWPVSFTCKWPLFGYRCSARAVLYSVRVSALVQGEVTLSEYKRRFSELCLWYSTRHAGRHLFAMIYQISDSVYSIGK